MLDPMFHIGNRLFRGVGLRLTVEAARQNYTLLSAKSEALISRPEAATHDVVFVEGGYTVLVTLPNNLAAAGCQTVQRVFRWTLTTASDGQNTPTLFSERWFCAQEFAVVGQAVGIVFPGGRVTGLYPLEVQGRVFATDNAFRTAAVAILPGTPVLLPS